MCVCWVGGGAGGRGRVRVRGVEHPGELGSRKSETSNGGKHENWIWTPSQSMEYKPPNLPKGSSRGGAPEVDRAGEGGHMGVQVQRQQHSETSSGLRALGTGRGLQCVSSAAVPPRALVH